MPRFLTSLAQIRSWSTPLTIASFVLISEGQVFCYLNCTFKEVIAENKLDIFSLQNRLKIHAKKVMKIRELHQY